MKVLVPVKRVVEQPGVVQAFEETALYAKLPGLVGWIEDDPDKKTRPPKERQIDIDRFQVVGANAAQADQRWSLSRHPVTQHRVQA